MGKKQPHTPKSQVKSALRQLWLRSRERASAIKRDNYTCQDCGAKQSRAKGKEVYVEVHHLNGISWQKIEEYIYRHLLVDPKNLETLCKSCHENAGKGSRLDDRP